MQKTIIFVLLNEFADWEFSYLAAKLNDGSSEGKYEVKTLSLTTDPIKSIGGLRVIPDYSITNFPLDFSGLVLIGGNSWRKDESKRITKIIDTGLENSVPIGAICDATTFLGKNRYLNRVSHTSNRLEDLQSYAEGNYTNEEAYRMEQAVSDQNIITANGTAALEFAKQYYLALEPEAQNEMEQWYNFHKFGFYEALKRNMD
ncbi:type 1 glutamine amidotransferase family protein [Sporosarcina sp. NPDC096371]|uniref:type 1 glutamine amidotransferase family protein n=1 Tax=Sporosarcina sp. NPDC096371 TaxID=3364530 RepID=UPI00380E2C7A